MRETIGLADYGPVKRCGGYDKWALVWQAGGSVIDGKEEAGGPEGG